MTIKYGKGYEETWATFKGEATDVRAELIDYFGLTGTESLTMHELVSNATSIAHGTSLVAAKLGGTVIPAASPKAATAPASAPAGDEAQTGGDAWAEAESTPEVHPIFAKIEEAPTVAALKRLWAENQPAFKVEGAMAAYQAKGKALSAAEKSAS